MFTYLKFTLAIFLSLSTIFSLFVGNHFVWYFFGGMSAFIIFADYFLPSDTSITPNVNNNILNFIMYLSLPIHAFLIFLLLWFTNNGDLFQFSTFIHEFFNIDIFAVRNSLAPIDLVGYAFSIGLILGGVGINLGHELTHRKHNWLDLWVGNALLTLSCDRAFAIEHVHGHHKNVGLFHDPATARRGEFIYSFIIRSIIGEHKNAFKIEKKRLQKQNHQWLSLQNRYLRGLLYTAIIFSITFVVSGISGVGYMFIAMLWAKILLEAVNYIEHYGLIRVEGKAIRPRHSWNSNKWLSSALLFNLTRHSAHHEKATLEFWELSPYEDAPEMPFGYLASVYFALIFPFTYIRLMKKKLADWDANHASKEELALISNLY